MKIYFDVSSLSHIVIYVGCFIFGKEYEFFFNDERDIYKYLLMLCLACDSYSYTRVDAWPVLCLLWKYENNTSAITHHISIIILNIQCVYNKINMIHSNNIL